MENDEPLRIQGFCSSWWVKTESKRIEAGRLAWTFVPYPDVQTKGLILEGRSDPRDHTKARFRLEPLCSGGAKRRSDLPVAALPTRAGESYVVQRGKRRPVLILSLGGKEIPKSVLQGGPGYYRKPCVLVLPFYGVDKDGKRGGFSEEFIQRVRCLEYPQYMFDKLPISGTSESILRFDHILAVGSAISNYELTEYRLSSEAFELILDWFRWVVEGTLSEESFVAEVRKDLVEINEIR